MGNAVNALSIFGGMLVLLGGIGLAVPVFTTQETTELAQLGDLKVQTQESTSHAIPPLASGAALALGIILIGVGLSRRRS